MAILNSIRLVRLKVTIGCSQLCSTATAVQLITDKGAIKGTIPASLSRLQVVTSSHFSKTSSIIKVMENLSTITTIHSNSNSINLTLLTTDPDPAVMTQHCKLTIKHSRNPTTSSSTKCSTSRAATPSGDRLNQSGLIPILPGYPNLKASSRCRECFPISYSMIRTSNNLTVHFKYRNSRVRTRQVGMLKQCRHIAIKTRLSRRPWLVSASRSISIHSALAQALKGNSIRPIALHFSIRVDPIKTPFRTDSSSNQAPVMHMANINRTVSTPLTRCKCT